ncbi:radical SAM protein [Butyricicoccus faecihominis]|uniref:radical SAM protein n=1 Tax=Butyricicoccus faecihominis TaxID=1712515 RepID=UPI003AF33D87
MRIGLIDVDSHNFPNLCLMKLSAYHKAQGHQVCWWNPLFSFDVVYKSRVFTDTYSKDTITVTNAGTIIRGGTGYGPGPSLPDEIEHTYPDYALYPQYSETAYGFLSRGCPRNCGFCIVSGKEGRKSVKVADLSEFWRGQREIKLLDPNLLACPDHENLLEQLAESQAWVDFSQGLDIRLITPDNVALLNRVRTKAVHFAWDNPNEDLTRYFQRFAELTSIKSSRNRRVYVLTNYGSTHEQDLYRVETLRCMGFDPYVMIYERPTALQITRHLQRWVNNKRLFYAVPSFSDYEPVKKLRDGIETR